VLLHDDARLNASRHEIPPAKADIHRNDRRYMFACE
jgi:hypothetical protein